MNLYKITYDGQPYHVEAPSFPAAIDAWKGYLKAEWKEEDWDGTEEPESVCLLESEHPVIRQSFSEQSVGVSDRVDTRDFSETF